MPIPLAVACFNRVTLNRVVGHFAGQLRPFALVEHRGRRSGAVYHTPVLLFHDRGELLIALTYGRDTDWLRNTRAAGGCTVIERNRRIVATDPFIATGATATTSLPCVVRLILSLTGVDEVLHLTPGEVTPPV